MRERLLRGTACGWERIGRVVKIPAGLPGESAAGDVATPVERGCKEVELAPRDVILNC